MAYKHSRIENIYSEELWHITNTVNVESTVTVLTMKQKLKLMC